MGSCVYNESLLGMLVSCINELEAMAKEVPLSPHGSGGGGNTSN